MKRLYFMRHGESVHNSIGKFSGRINSPLTEDGMEEVKLAALFAKGLDLDTLVSSPMSRTVDSAKIIALEIDYDPGMILINDLFSERDFGSLEGKTYEPLAVRDDVEDIESVEDLMKRAQKGLEWLMELNAENILLVSHGSLGRALRTVISAHIPFEHPIKFKNASIVQLL